MNINLKQPEIELAIRQYLERQGISLRSKSVTVDFTSGRGNNGLSAEVIIENVSIPGDDIVGSTGPGPSAEVLAMANDNAKQAAASTEAAKAPAKVKEVAVEVAAAPVATASIATPETEATAAAPVAEAKVAEGAAETLVTADTAVAAPAKTTTSLFDTP